MPTGARPARGMGRPPKTEEENLRTRRRIIDAAAEVYADHGFRGVTVARITETGGLSRGLFYKHFKNAAEPVEALLEQVHAGLVPGILAAAALPPAPEDKIAAAIDAYLDWADGLGRLLRPVAAELHDTGSPVFRIRSKVQDTLLEPLRRAVADNGLPVPGRYEITVMISALEFACFRRFVDPDVDRATARSTMLRLAMAALGIQADARAPEAGGGTRHRSRGLSGSNAHSDGGSKERGAATPDR